MTLAIRLATARDLPAMTVLMKLAIDELQCPFLSPAEIAASHAVMGLDRQLVADGTYYVVENDAALAGCGGWSPRATLYGGDHSKSLRDGRLLDPVHEPARIRAMYTHPDFVRRGVGRLILSTCEAAARAGGFTRVELMATMAGEPLYRACGYEVIEHVRSAASDGVSVPLMRMGKALASD
jgi:GNAT superfamily N-acetyltransferase